MKGLVGLVGSLVLLCVSFSASAQDVEAFLKKSMNIQSLEPSMLHANAKIVQTSGGQEKILNKRQFFGMLTQLRRSGATSEWSNFVIIGKRETDAYVSVIYRFTSTVKIGSTVTTSQVTAHDVLQKTKTGLQLIFSASEG
jgi:hypothetical protein